MTVVTVEKPIAATPDAVFHAVTEVASSPERFPEVERVDILDPGRDDGTGLRFREHRRSGRKSMTFELERTGYDADARRARFVTHSGGTRWDTVMQVHPHAGGSRLVISMEAHGDRWLNRMVNRVMRPLFRRGMTAHVEALRVSLEGG